MLLRTAWRGLRAMVGRMPSPASGQAARHMSFSIPASGTNLALVVLGGSSLTAALFYAYKTSQSETAMRHKSQITDIQTRLNTPADDSAPVAEVTTVAEDDVVETEKASEGPDPELVDQAEEPAVVAVVAGIDEGVAEAVTTMATEPAPEAVESVVAMVMEATSMETEALVAAETSVTEMRVTVTEETDKSSAVKVAAAA